MSDIVDPIPIERLLAAVDAIYAAHRERADEGGLTLYPPDLFGTSMQPEAFDGFGEQEIEEATRFLVRLGLLIVCNDC